MMPKLVMFDLDGTLTDSKQPLSGVMASLLSKLLAHTKVGIISGSGLAQFLKQVVAMLPLDADLGHLYLLPTSGGALYEYGHDTWKKIYEERLTEKEKEEIEDAMREAARATKVIDFSKPAWGERIEFRGPQVTLSALGQQAPFDDKKAWDPNRKKRAALQAELARRLPKFTVGMGGSTSVDVTKRGIDKAYGIRKLCARLNLREPQALFVGDELVAGGNDEAVYNTDAVIHPVKGPADTEKLIRKLLAE